jgi:hypothetical protein
MKAVIGWTSVRLKAIGLKVSHQNVLRAIMLDILLSTTREDMSPLTVHGGPALLADSILKDVQVETEPQNKSHVFIRESGMVICRVRGQECGASLGGEIGQEGGFRRVEVRQCLPILTPIPRLGKFFFWSLGTEDCMAEATSKAPSGSSVKAASAANWAVVAVPWFGPRTGK